MIALVQGTSRGLGLALVAELLQRGARVFATARDPDESDGLKELAASHEGELHPVVLDVTDEGSIERAARQVRAETDRLDLVINSAGVLNGPGSGPEKRLEDVDAAATAGAFAVNAIGPLLLAKHFVPFIAQGERAVWANISARVGSIGDNGKGGWYSYRASKAAQNQVTRTLSIELRRRAEGAICVALHPGTVDTEMSKPFQKHVPEAQLFDRSRAAQQLLDIIDGLESADTGRFFAWDGAPIEW